MKEWNQTGVHQVNAILSKDADYQNLLKQLDEAQTEYREATAALSCQQQEQIERYIALCEELEYQKTFTAYYCGKRNG